MGRVYRYFAVTRVPHDFLFDTQPIFDVVAVLPAK
jgi:hypothetical protein